MTDRWIVITRWDGKDGFQHYRDRDPVWIKNYRSLLKSDEYRELSLAQRGALHGLWLEYAASNREIRDNTLAITRRLGQRVTRATLDALNHAGFIEYSASRPLAPRYPDAMPEVEKEKEPPNPRRRGGSKSSPQTTEPRIHTCPTCRLPFKAKSLLDEHIYHSHDGPEPAHWVNQPVAQDEEPPIVEPELELPPPEERHRIAEEVRAQLIGVAAKRPAGDNGTPPPLEFFLDTEPPEDE